jgi:hypothetical protein
MRDPSTFETRLADALGRYADMAPRMDEVVIARQASYGIANAGRRWLPRSLAFIAGTRMGAGQTTHRRRIPGLLVLVAAALLVALFVGGAIAVGAGLIRFAAIVPPSLAPEATPATRPAPSQSGPIATQTAAPVGRRWTATGSMVETRFGESVTLLPDGQVLMAGGNSAYFDGFPSASAELYDPRTGRWTATGSMNTGRAGHGAVLLADGRVLVIGGAGVAPLPEAEIYDPSTGAWTATANLVSPPTFTTATRLLDDRILVTGVGDTIGLERSAELFDPVSGRWSAAAPMNVARTSHTATLLPDGQVLVVGGGCCGKKAIASAELFDPVTGKWTETGQLASARRRHSAVLLADGEVLVYGGDNNGVAVKTAELYDPATGTWAATASPRNDGAAVRLGDGRVLVKGQASGELYDPAKGSWSSVGGPTHGHLDYTTTLLLDGRVLVTYVEAAVLFDPGGTP